MDRLAAMRSERKARRCFWRPEQRDMFGTPGGHDSAPRSSGSMRII